MANVTEQEIAEKSELGRNCFCGIETREHGYGPRCAGWNPTIESIGTLSKPTPEEIAKAREIAESVCFLHFSDEERLEAATNAIATALAAASSSQLQSDVDKFWLALERSWDIEPREFFEKEARENGFDSPLAMAVHYMWKRETKPSVSQWQPMSSAPRDGTEVILFVERRAGIAKRMLVGHYMPGGYCIEDHPAIDEGWYFWSGSMFDKASKPLFWQSLPAPPVKEKP